MKSNRRAAERYESVGLMTSIFDGSEAVIGVVDDVSRGGMRVSTIPASFGQRVETWYALVYGYSRDFHLALHPRWSAAAETGMYKVMGFEINDPSREWDHFIESIEHEQGADMVAFA